MAIRCPACKRVNSGEDSCKRCGMDLSVLLAIHSASKRYLELSRRNILSSKGNDALICAQCAWDLIHTRKAAKLAFLSCILLERYEQATQWYIWVNQI
ncbi:MAG: hypothetical protein PVI90_14185 [Desulfobacteraceae bacterium]|jgi:hypothetical protein